jgi:hypothetical protein
MMYAPCGTTDAQDDPSVTRNFSEHATPIKAFEDERILECGRLNRTHLKQRDTR